MFTKEVIRYNPTDLVGWSREFFTRLHHGEIDAFLAENRERKIATMFADETRAQATSLGIGMFAAMAKPMEFFTATFPVTFSEEDKKARRELFQAFDRNHNGFLSLAEIGAGIKSLIQIPADLPFNLMPAIRLAYDSARRIHQSKSTDRKRRAQSDAYIERQEFRMFFAFLQLTCSLLVAFNAVDSDGDRRVTEEEFTPALSIVQEQCAMNGVVMRIDPAAVFQLLDKDGSGHISFFEFAQWGFEALMSGVSVDQT